MELEETDCRLGLGSISHGINLAVFTHCCSSLLLYSPFLSQSEEHTHPPVRNIAGEDLHLKTNPSNYQLLPPPELVCHPGWAENCPS